MPRTLRTTPRLLTRFMGGSTLFNGTTSVIDCGSELVGTGDVTVSVWIKAKSFGEGTFGMILENGKFKLNINNGDAPGRCFQFSSNGSTNASSGGGSAVLNRWIHILITRTVSGITNIYINGVLSGTAGQSSGTPATGTTNLFIGNRSANDRTFDGYIAEACIVKRIVTEAERYAIMNGDIPSDASDFYPLDDQPSTYIDSIGGANGTGTNTTYSQDVPVQQRVAIDEEAQASLSMDGNADYITLTTPITPGTITFETKMRSTLFRTYFFNSSLNRTIQTTASGFWQTYDGGDRISNFLARANVWDKMAFVYDGTGYKIYRNGQFVSKISPSEQIAIEIISRNSSDAVSGNLKNVRMWSQATQLTHQQIRDLHFNNVVPTDGLVGEWKLNEGAGTVAYDTSGNGNHGTITGATWSSDVPSKKRTFVGDNLVKNGDFAYQPPFVANQTTTGMWLNGTSSGSTSKLPINIHVSFGGAAGDKYARMVIRNGIPCVLVHINPGAYAEVRIGSTTYYATRKNQDFDVKPNTQYKLSGYLESENVSGDCSDGTWIRAIISKGDGTFSEQSDTPKIKTNIPRTYFETVFTTKATSRCGHIEFRVYGHTAAATLAGDFYFSDIKLIEVGAARTLHP